VPFNEVIPSWNIDLPPGAGLCVELRVGRTAGDVWSKFYYLGSWGAAPKVETKTVKDERGAIEIDYFSSRETFDRIQYRIRSAAGRDGNLPALRRFALAYSNTLNDAQLAKWHRPHVDPTTKEGWARRLPVPFRSQNVEDPAIRGSICSPTSV